MRKTLQERLLQRILIVGDCWMWTGRLSKKGYGSMRVSGRRTRVHRASYELYKGPVPDGLFICHQCDNPACVNPDHLFAGTNSDNLQDAANKGRLSYQRNTENFMRGTGHKQSRLTEDHVRDMRSLYAEEGLSVNELGARFGISHVQAYRIVKRIHWKHLE
jgi:hypothetical protein